LGVWIPASAGMEIWQIEMVNSMTELSPMYNRLAGYYDLTHHFRDYRQQSEFIHAVIQKYSSSAKKVLDICCGTGSHAVILAEKGYLVTGVDNSKEMLNLARGKIKTRARNPKFESGDMFELKYSEQFDAAYCFGTTLMMINSLEEFSRFLTSVRKTLKPSGLLIFDVWNGWKMLQATNEMHPSENETARVIWFSNGHINREQRTQHLESAFLIQENNKTRIETFTEDLKIFFKDEIQWLLESHGFTIETILGNDSLDRVYMADSEYIIPVARRRE
jgi:ubiquinone/menaquinone biosynthesis C-methylase UbiE